MAESRFKIDFPAPLAGFSVSGAADDQLIRKALTV